MRPVRFSCKEEPVMSARFQLLKPSRALPVLGAVAILAFAAHGATAQSATGTVTGRVLWGSCLRGIPLPMTPDGGNAAQPVPPDVQIAPGPGSRPQPIPQPVNGLPAGAVLVAVQGTSINARTDEAGKFTLSGVPAGQYMTVAAGPVADAVSASAARPNVFVSGGQSVDLGTLALGGSSATPYGIGCRFPMGVDPAQGGATNPATPSETLPPANTIQPADTSNP
jgi:hypothetical protein